MNRIERFSERVLSTLAEALFNLLDEYPATILLLCILTAVVVMGGIIGAVFGLVS